jgi:hypothetical protein
MLRLLVRLPFLRIKAELRSGAGQQWGILCLVLQLSELQVEDQRLTVRSRLTKHSLRRLLRVLCVEPSTTKAVTSTAEF